MFDRTAKSFLWLSEFSEFSRVFRVFCEFLLIIFSQKDFQRITRISCCFFPSSFLCLKFAANFWKLKPRISMELEFIGKLWWFFDGFRKWWKIWWIELKLFGDSIYFENVNEIPFLTPLSIITLNTRRKLRELKQKENLILLQLFAQTSCKHSPKLPKLYLQKAKFLKILIFLCKEFNQNSNGNVLSLKNLAGSVEWDSCYI